jgi:cytochrome b6-f complex iron-sulfur subunit
MADAAALESPALTRREFLYYIWAASTALFLAGSGGAVLWFAFPRFREGEFGGIFSVPVSSLPQPNSGPLEIPEVKLWLVNTDQGMLGIYKVCTHLGCLYKWVPPNSRFECPCHGSKFELDGTYIEGPAPRSLDRFEISIVDADGNMLAQSDEEGNPVEVPGGAAEIKVNTGQRIDGKPSS